MATLPLLVCVAGCSSGCVVSRHPLSDEKTSIADERLLGLWEIVEENASREPGRFQVERKPDSKVTLLVKSSDPADKDPLEIIATELGKRRYLSVRGVEQEKRREEWCILEYELIDANSIRVRWMNPKIVADDVKEKRVKGSTKERETKPADKKNGKEETVATDVYLDEPMEKLREYVEKGGEKLFEKEWMNYKRIESK